MSDRVAGIRPGRFDHSNLWIAIEIPDMVNTATDARAYFCLSDCEPDVFEAMMRQQHGNLVLERSREHLSTRPRYPTVLRLPLLLGVLAACRAAAEPPPHHAEITAWAASAGVTLSTSRTCTGIEEQHFASLGSVCWSAKARQEQPPNGSRMFPRFEITMATYADAAKATERIARFHEVPASLSGEAGKTYPLRAGFRLGSRVVIVTTDALAFDAETCRAAAALATATAGTELVCWTDGDGPR